MQVLSPHKLKRGNRIGVFVCGDGAKHCHPDALRLYKRRLSNLGLQVMEGSNFLESQGGNRAGLPELRTEVFHDMIRNPNIAGLLSFWGGNHTNEVLPYLDFAAIRKARKPIIGYSDTTCLQLAIFARSRLITYTGPAGITFGKESLSERTLDSFLQVCFEDVLAPKGFSLKSGYTYPFPESWQVFQDGVAEGCLVGGNLSAMMLLAGTSFWPDFQESVLYLEMSEDQDYEQFENQLCQLNCMKVFKQVKGLLFGRFSTSVEHNHRLKGFLKGFTSLGHKPILMDFDCGHGATVLTLPIGGKIEINVPEKRLLLRSP